MKDQTTVTYKARFAVPSNGEEIWSESDFDTPETALELLKVPFEEGQISQYEIWQVVTVTTKRMIESNA